MAGYLYSLPPVSNEVRVLLADGEERVRTAMFRALLDRYVFCDCVASGGDAIEQFSQRGYALLILDFDLPRAGAAAVLEAVRDMPPALRPIVIAVASGSVAREVDSDLVHMILRKPLRIVEAADMVQACLTHKRTA